MARKIQYKKGYTEIVMDMALARHKVSNAMVGKRLSVTEATVRNWRKENPEFDRAFTEARDMLREKINDTARKSLDVRKRKVISNGPKGLTTTVEEVLPTHSDVAVFGKVLGLGHSIHSEENARRDILRDLMRQKVAGKITALDAAQLLEAEGIPVPETLMYEIQKGSKEEPKEIKLTPEQRRARIAELKDKIYGGTEPGDNAG